VRPGNVDHAGFHEGARSQMPKALFIVLSAFALASRALSQTPNPFEKPSATYPPEEKQTRAILTEVEACMEANIDKLDDYVSRAEKIALALRALCADERVMSRMDATWETARQADRRDLTLRLLNASETKILPEILAHRVGRRNNTNQPRQ
jgi:hypothetical protein